MKFTLLLLWCACIGLSASAQLPLFKRHVPLPEIANPAGLGLKLPPARIPHPKLYATSVARSDYNLELSEAYMMKTAQHNMRFRVYDVASYNFYDLARLYIQQNRLSEAKWFFLQSTIISREQNNNKLTIANLLQLANIKASIGDFVLAQQDLLEARSIASSKGYLNDLLEVEKNLTAIQRNRFVSARTDLRYDDALQKVAVAD